MLNQTFRAFRYRDFRIMWLGACTSTTGTWMQILAQSWLVYQLSDSSLYLGLDAFFAQIPIFLFSMFGGVFADRQSRRKLLIISQFIQMGSAFLLAALDAAGIVRVWQIWCLSFTVGLAQSFGGPAYSALIPTLVGKDEIQNAIALNSIQFNVARVLGPALGGIALSKLGASWCFGLNGLSFIAVIASLLVIRPPFVPQKTHESVIASIREAISFLRKREGMSSLVILAFFSTLLSYPLITFLPVMARDVFHGGSNIFTLFLCLSGVGSIVGALAVAAERGESGQGRKSLLIMIGLGCLMGGFGFSRSIALSSVLLFGSGAALLAVFAFNSSLIQLRVSDSMRGRVMSVYNVAFRGGMPVGSLISGGLIGISSAPIIMAANGAAMIVLALLFLLPRRDVTRL
ncbi:MAG TPA: MFS transporter [Bryobacteraceae bacterium]